MEARNVLTGGFKPGFGMYPAANRHVLMDLQERYSPNDRPHLVIEHIAAPDLKGFPNSGNYPSGLGPIPETTRQPLVVVGTREDWGMTITYSPLKHSLRV